MNPKDNSAPNFREVDNCSHCDYIIYRDGKCKLHPDVKHLAPGYDDEGTLPYWTCDSFVETLEESK
jgi:hypothetical protein